MMDLVHDRANIITEEDRISNLPEDIIHYILFFLDMKDAIQTRKLSRKWNHIWASMPHLNLNSPTFPTLPQFANFVKHALSHRNNHVKVSAVNLTFRGAVTQFAVRSILNYAYSHNVQQLTIEWYTKKLPVLPEHVFSSHSLKHLTLVIDDQSPYRYKCCHIPKSAWDFPVLETLVLRNIHFHVGDDSNKSLNLFSKCVNLKYLTLHECSSYLLETFNICAPQLSNLTISAYLNVAKVINVVVPQLKNLMLTVTSSRFNFLEPFPDGFSSIEKVNLSLPARRHPNDMYALVLLDLFQKLCSAKFVILDMEIIQTIASSLDRFSHGPCPFNNLKHLKINRGPHTISTVPSKVINYLLENSPSATVIMDLAQVPHKRSRHQVPNDTVAKKMARLESETKQPETMTEENCKEKPQMQD